MAKELTFEQAQTKLEETIKKMESNDCTLEQSVELYKEAMSYLSLCSDKLKEAKAKIVELNDEE